MASLSISRAWEESTRFAGREFGLLYPIALLLLELPLLATMLVTPLVITQPTASEVRDFQDLINQFGGISGILLIISLSLVAFVIQTFGTLAISWLAVRPGSRVADSFAVAGRRLPAVLGSILLMGVGLTLLMLPLWLLVVGASPRPSAGTGAGILLMTLLLLVFFIALFPRLALTTPAGVAERLGPVAILGRSWQLTKGHFWRLLGAIVLIGIVFMIVAMVLGLLFATITTLLVGPPETNFTAAFVFELLNSLFMAAYAVFMICFVARIYAQLTESEADPA